MIYDGFKRCPSPASFINPKLCNDRVKRIYFVRTIPLMLHAQTWSVRNVTPGLPSSDGLPRELVPLQGWGLM